jgi:hypothetical protein
MKPNLPGDVNLTLDSPIVRKSRSRAIPWRPFTLHSKGSGFFEVTIVGEVGRSKGIEIPCASQCGRTSIYFNER